MDTPIYERAASGTGRRPATLPDSYHPDAVAAVLVEAALEPRHDRLVGGQSRLVELLYRHGRPAGELLLVFVDRWFRTGTIPAEAPGALWEPARVARVSGGIPARASGDLTALAGHVAGAAARAIRTAPELLRPVPERLTPGTIVALAGGGCPPSRGR